MMLNDAEKNQHSSNKKSMATGAILGAVITAIGFSAVVYTLFNQPQSELASQADPQKPLYWVAPMDPNYKRDKPGKSPMGMDLIPVYAEENTSNDVGPGAVKISPEVVNNLGVKTDLVQFKKLHSKIKTVGYVKYNEDLLVHLHPRVEGWIDKLYIKAEGDPIRKGEPVYEIYSPALVNAQEELLLALDRNNRRLIRAAEERLSALQIPESVIEQLKKTRKVSQNITFYSPQSGVVDNLNIRQGFFVKPGTTLMSIGSLEQVWVKAEIFERQVPWVKTGMPVTMKLDYLPGREWEGQVDYIYPTLDANTRTVKVRLKFNNTEQLLKPNMFAQVVIHSQSQEPSLVIPKEALIRTGRQDRVVLALEDGRFKSIAVRVGAQDSDLVEILEGLNDGERIVTSAQFLIDSESSKSSDFKRMASVEEQSNESMQMSAVQSATVSGVINRIDKKRRLLNITRGPIKKWDRPAATMDFIVDGALDIAAVEEKQEIEFTFEIRDEFVIVDWQLTMAEQNHDGHH